jgi:hypothetical protein
MLSRYPGTGCLVVPAQGVGAPCSSLGHTTADIFTRGPKGNLKADCPLRELVLETDPSRSRSDSKAKKNNSFEG